MQWDDTAIILSARKLGEHAAIVHVLSAQHGLYAGVDKGALGKRRRGIYQPGNIVAAHWQARIAEQLGMFTCELTESVASHVLDDRRKLAALSSATRMAEKILSERESQPAVYARMETLVRALREDAEWLAAYVQLEFALLTHAGFGLDLERCAATGQQHDLAYVSPRTGRAVSREAGAPYHGRLFALPIFLSSSCEPRSGCAGSEQDPVLTAFAEQKPRHGMTDILDGLRLCGHFLQERIFAPRNLPMPPARQRFTELLRIGEAEAVG